MVYLRETCCIKDKSKSKMKCVTVCVFGSSFLRFAAQLIDALPI